MKKLIVNADDFGIHPLVNQGIINGHKAGLISSTTLMAGGEGFDHAVDLLHRTPTLKMGIHLSLVGAKPVLPPSEVSSLIESDGNFPAMYPAFLSRWFRGNINKQEIEKELTAQIVKVQNTGLTITHVDSHQHMHVVPGIIDIVLTLLHRFNIPAMRIPAENIFFTGGFPLTPGRFIGRGGLSVLASMAARKAKAHGIFIPECFFGMLAGGCLKLSYLTNILRALPQNATSEIMVHPGQNSSLLQDKFGWPYHWQEELDALTSLTAQNLLKEEGICLVSYGDRNL